MRNVAQEPAEPEEQKAPEKPPAAPLKPQPEVPAEPPVTPQEEPEPSVGIKTPAAKPKPQKAAPPEAVPEAPPALGEPVPAKKAPGPSPADIKKRLGPRPKDEAQGAIHDRMAGRIAKEIPNSIPMRPLRNKKGQLQADEKGNPKWEPEEYNIASSPMLAKEGKALGIDKEGTVAKAPEGTADELEPGDLYYLKQNKDGTPSDDRLRVSHLNKVSAVGSFADKLVDFFHSVKDDKEIMGAAGWYPEIEQMLKEHFGPHANLAAHLLAATSAGTGVRPNFTMAMNALERYLHGDFDRHIDLYKKAHAMREAGTLRQHVAELTGEPLLDKDSKAMARYIVHHDILPVQLHGPKFGFNSKAVLKVLANTWLGEAEGPKTPNYGGNLSGRTLQATIDMWAARTMRRLGYEGHTDKPWLYNPPAEGGVNNVDFGLSQLAFREAAKRLDMEPRVLQAVLWFAEQKHYQKQGWEKWVDPAERDYRPMLRSLMEHGPLTTHLPTKEPRAATHKTVPKAAAFAQGGLVQKNPTQELLYTQAAPIDPYDKAQLTNEIYEQMAQPVQHFRDGGYVWSPFAPAPAAPGVVQPMSGGAPRAQSVPQTVRRAQLVESGSSASTSPVVTGPATLPTGSPTQDSTQASPLANARSAFASELASNPDLMLKLTNSAYREVGNQGSQAWQAYLESVMNRGAARNQSLDATITSLRDATHPHGYYPHSTFDHLNDPLNKETQAFQSKLNPLLQSVLAGSNVAGYATGNESGDVKSGNSPIAFEPDPSNPKGERFVVENPDLEWASKFSTVPILSTRGMSEE